MAIHFPRKWWHWYTVRPSLWFVETKPIIIPVTLAYYKGDILCLRDTDRRYEVITSHPLPIPDDMMQSLKESGPYWLTVYSDYVGNAEAHIRIRDEGKMALFKLTWL